MQMAVGQYPDHPGCMLKSGKVPQDAGRIAGLQWEIQGQQAPPLPLTLPINAHGWSTFE